MTKKKVFSEEDFKRIQQAEVAKNNGKTAKKSLTTKVQSEIDKAKNEAAQKQSTAQKLQNEAQKAKIIAIDAQKKLSKISTLSKK